MINFNKDTFVKARLLLAGALTSLLFTNASIAQKTQNIAKENVAVQRVSNKEQDAAAQNLVNRLSLMSNLAGKFEQHITDESNEELQKTKGDFVLKRPGNLWWETAPPFEQLVVSNGEKLWVYDPDLEQVTVYPKEQVQAGPASILNGSLNAIRARYKVSERLDSIQKGTSKVPGAIFTLTPNNAQAGSFDKVVLAFSDHDIQQVSMTDKLGQTTSINFYDTSKNKEIDEAIFNFTPPEGTDIVLDGE